MPDDLQLDDIQESQQISNLTSQVDLTNQLEKLRKEIARLKEQNSFLQQQMLPTTQLLPIQTTVMNHHSNPKDSRRRQIVKDEFLHAWNAYKQYAWGCDDVHPLSRRGSNGYHMGLTLIDALDTIILMELEDEYKACRAWIVDNITPENLKHNVEVNVFEVTIRVIGGLLSAYYLKNDDIMLEKAALVADELLVAFNTPSGLPITSVNLESKKAVRPQWTQDASTAEVGTLQLEWATLGRATRRLVYTETVTKLNTAVSNIRRDRNLFTKFIDPNSGELRDSTITLGARVDSIYEYFLKQHIMSPKLNPDALRLYQESIKAIREHLVVTCNVKNLRYIRELEHGSPIDKMDHLVCFLPGLLALGSKYVEQDGEEHLHLAKDLMKTCFEMYKLERTGLSPEIVRFNSGMHVDPGARHNLLRPETLESLHVLHSVTGDELYKEWGWEIFQAFRNFCKVPGGGYSSIGDVGDTSTRDSSGSQNWKDHMESFFLAETIKYAYLLFSDPSVLPLDKWVFNTEAHPLPIWN